MNGRHDLAAANRFRLRRRASRRFWGRVRPLLPWRALHWETWR